MTILNSVVEENNEIPWLHERDEGDKTPLPLDELEAEYVASVMRALAHPDRVEILCILGIGPSAVLNLAIGLDLPQATMSKHLRILREAELVASSVEGKTRVYSLTRPHIIQAIATMAQDLAE